MQEEFTKEREQEDGSKLMAEATKIINDIGENFLELDGDELARHKAKLIGYKFRLADYMCNLSRMFESLKMQSKQEGGALWKEIATRILAEKGKPATVDEIKNEVSAASHLIEESMLYETLYHKFRIKLSAMDDAMTAITQRIKELTNQVYDARQS